jgi:pyridoxine 5-phosphate synthase
MNFELSCAQEIVQIALSVRPYQATLVPEKRQEVTTEGGLDLRPKSPELLQAIASLKDSGILVSLFIDPDQEQVRIAKELGAHAVELHTGQYAEARRGVEQDHQLKRLENASRCVNDMGLKLHAGHGLTYQNVRPIAAIAGMRELNIGHSIISRAVLVGIKQAVEEMKKLLVVSG